MGSGRDGTPRRCQVPDTIERRKAGKLGVEYLGVAATERHFIVAPMIPTFREQGFEVVVGSWRCIVGPKGIPADRLALPGEQHSWRR